MFQLNYQSHKSVYEQIVDNIKEQIQKVTDAYIAKIDEILKVKEADLLAV